VSRLLVRAFAGWRTGLSRPVTVLQAGTAINYFGTDWRDFLNQKVSDAHVRQERIVKIEAWQAIYPKPGWTPTPEVETINAELREMIVAFGHKCAELRKAVAEAKAATSPGSRAALGGTGFG
jgi:hypothetical protein